MDLNTNMPQAPIETSTQAQTPQAPMAGAPAAPAVNEELSSSMVYASFWKRFAAFLVDLIILGIVGGILGAIFGGSSSNLSASSTGVNAGFSAGPVPTLLSWIYLVAMDVKYGATLGKMALKIKVVRVDNGEYPDVVKAILREIVGRFVSSIVLLLGYFWMIWDPKKQTWHDKIAGTVVVESQ